MAQRTRATIGAAMPSADLSVRLTPRADRNAITPPSGAEPFGVLRARVTAPPADGQANAALIRLIAKALGVPPSRVSIVRGQSARDKVVRVDGITAADAHARLADDD
ncbi:MAG TPA: DUF167 domain-containing protein [Baekduia sp.]|nr:DUF167 domain-containing protein [Baekduia sp.]